MFGSYLFWLLLFNFFIFPTNSCGCGGCCCCCCGGDSSRDVPCDDYDSGEWMPPYFNRPGAMAMMPAAPAPMMPPGGGYGGWLGAGMAAAPMYPSWGGAMNPAALGGGYRQPAAPIYGGHYPAPSSGSGSSEGSYGYGQYPPVRLPSPPSTAFAQLGGNKRMPPAKPQPKPSGSSGCPSGSCGSGGIRNVQKVHSHPGAVQGAAMIPLSYLTGGPLQINFNNNVKGRAGMEEMDADESSDADDDEMRNSEMKARINLDSTEKSSDNTDTTVVLEVENSTTETIENSNVAGRIGPNEAQETQSETPDQLTTVRTEVYPTVTDTYTEVNQRSLIEEDSSTNIQPRIGPAQTESIEELYRSEDMSNSTEVQSSTYEDQSSQTKQDTQPPMIFNRRRLDDDATRRFISDESITLQPIVRHMTTTITENQMKVITDVPQQRINNEETQTLSVNTERVPETNAFTTEPIKATTESVTEETMLAQRIAPEVQSPESRIADEGALSEEDSDENGELGGGKKKHKCPTEEDVQRIINQWMKANYKKIVKGLKRVAKEE